MAVTVTQGGLAEGTGTTVNLAAPAREPGDVVQFVSYSQYPATPQTTTGYTKVIDASGFTVWQQDTSTSTPAGNARLNFSQSGTYRAFFQVINGGTANPSEPETPTPAGGVAGLTMPARGWFDGGSGHQIDMNSAQQFQVWRGSPVDFLATWIDNYNGQAWGYGIGAPAAGFTGLLDIAIGGPENGFSSGSTTNRFPAVADGADDARITTLARRLRTERTIGGVLRPTIIRAFHEMDGNWFRWSVRSSNLSDYGKIMKRWRAIFKAEFPEAIWAVCMNADAANTDVTNAQLWTAAGGGDLYGSDRYNQYPTIGQTSAGVFTSWADGSTRGSADRPVGIQKHVAFAAARGVPIYFPEYANNNYDPATPTNQSTDATWVTANLNYLKANAGKVSGKVLAAGWFNQIKDNDRWIIYRTDGGPVRNTATANAYRAFFQQN